MVDCFSLALIVIVDELSLPVSVDVIDMVAAGARESSIELLRDIGFDVGTTETTFAGCGISSSTESAPLTADGSSGVVTVEAGAGCMIASAVLRGDGETTTFLMSASAGHSVVTVRGDKVGGRGAGPLSFLATCENRIIFD